MAMGDKVGEAFVSSKTKSDDESVAGVVALAVLLLSVLLCCAVLLRCLKRRWDAWLTDIIEGAFDSADLDKSNSIDRTELYAAVLSMYCQVKDYVCVTAPDRAIVEEFMNSVHGSGTEPLDRAQFKAILRVLSRQLLGRALFQVVMTTLSPIVAWQLVELTVRAVRAMQLPASWLTVAPPQSLATAVISCILGSLLLPIFFLFIDAISAKAARKKEERRQERAGLEAVLLPKTESYC